VAATMALGSTPRLSGTSVSHRRYRPRRLRPFVRPR
jgi:hypothetical protein